MAKPLAHGLNAWLIACPPNSCVAFQLLITGSVLAFGSEITFIQVFGYSIALGGLVVFKTSGGK